MRRGQSVLEFAVLISFMSLVLILFLALGLNKSAEGQYKSDIVKLEDQVKVIEEEVRLASSSEDGYFRVFSIPSSIDGKSFSVVFVGRNVTLTNFTEIVASLDGSSYIYSSSLPQNVIGGLCKGKVVVTKQFGVVNLSCAECSNLLDDDLNGCVDHPEDLGCFSPFDTTEWGGLCPTECNNSKYDDGPDVYGKNCYDYPLDTGCSSPIDLDESGGFCACTDGSLFDTCSSNGKYCDNGTLIDACGSRTCGCADGFKCVSDTCIASDLKCDIDTSCSGVDLLHLSPSLENASKKYPNSHVALPNYSAYPNKVCCSSSVLMNNSCFEPDAYVVNLSSQNDSHVAGHELADYPFSVCLNSLVGTIKCGLINQSGVGDNVCKAGGYDTCLFTMSGLVNAHAAGCSSSDVYDVKVCCKTDV